MNTGLEQLLCVLGSKFLGVGNRGAVTDGGVERLVELANLALALQITHHIHREDTVGIGVGIDRVVAAVSGLVGFFRQLVHAGEAVLAVVGGGRGLDVVGVALGNDTAGGAQGDGRLAP